MFIRDKRRTLAEFVEDKASGLSFQTFATMVPMRKSIVYAYLIYIVFPCRFPNVYLPNPFFVISCVPRSQRPAIQHHRS